MATKLQNQAPSEVSGGCAMLFGLPFLLAGLGVAIFLYFPAISGWWQARDWIEIPCWIEKAELKESQGDDSTTYRIEAMYRYELDGRSYSGDRVALVGGGDNLGEFQQEKFRELELAYRKQKAFRCFVDTQRPSESILFRDLRWGMLLFLSVFATIFPLAGGFVMAGGLASSNARKKISALRQRYPEMPWKWKPEWAGDVITVSGDGLVALFAIAAWILITQLPLTYAVIASGALSESWLTLFTLLLPAIAMLPLWSVWRRWRSRSLTGTVSLRLQKWPLRPGEELDGTLLFSRMLSLTLPLAVRAKCVRRVAASSSDGTTTSESTRWEHVVTLRADEATREGGGCELPVRLSLPSDCPGADPSFLMEPSFDRCVYYWQIELLTGEGTQPIVLPLPVFGETVDGGNAPLTASDSLEGHEDSLVQRLKQRGIEARFLPDGLPDSFHCLPGRNRGTALFMIAFGAIWTGFLVVILVQDAPLIFKLAWGISAPLIELFGIYLLIHQRKLEFSDDSLRVMNQAAPFYADTKTLEPRHIVQFTQDGYMHSGTVRYYRVRAETIFGKKLTLIDGITDETTAEELVKRFEKWRGRGE
jgi:hypothetical protein